MLTNSPVTSHSSSFVSSPGWITPCEWESHARSTPSTGQAFIHGTEPCRKNNACPHPAVRAIHAARSDS